MKVVHIIFSIVCSLISSHAVDPEYTIFCHWDMESDTRKGHSSFSSWNLDSKLCTHFIYGSGASIDPNGSGKLKILNEELLIKRGLPEQITNMKQFKIKTVLSVGGWMDHSKRFSQMAADVRKRDQFYISLVKFLYEWQFSGVLIDWEYPMQYGGQTEDRGNFVTLLKELKIILQEHHFMLMVVVSARLDALTLASYDIPLITKYADFIVLNTHDHNDPYVRRLTYTSPLHGNASRSVERGVMHWVKHSRTPAKLLLGIPLFAQTFTLDDPSNTVVGAPSKGPGRQHAYSRRPGFMTVGEFCLQASTWKKKYDKLAEVPYAYKDDQWASYENGRSISAKVHLAMEQGLGGAVAWSIDADDFLGKCGERFGLLKVIISLMGDPNILTTQPTTTEGYGLCPKDGLFQHLWDCQLYYKCLDGQRTDYECLEGYYFDEELGRCKPSDQVKCDQNFITWRPGDKGYNFRNLPLNLRIVP